MKSFNLISICFFLSVFFCKAYSQEIKIVSNEFEDIVNIADYPLNKMEIRIPFNEEFLFVKIKNIFKIVNLQNENLVYDVDTIGLMDFNEFPYTKYRSISNEDAILDFLFKSVKNKKIKSISGVLSYLKKNTKTELVGSLNIGFNKNIISEYCPFKIFKYNEKQVNDYRILKKTIEARDKNTSIEVLAEDEKLLNEVFGPQGIQFSENQLIFLVTGESKKIIDVKFFDEYENEIEYFTENVIHERELISFNFDKKPDAKWNIKIYYEDVSSIVDIPFEIKVNI